MLDSRKEAILEAIVREYIKTNIPVGSLVLASEYGFPYSTATIRAEMAELERTGYLNHPHTSAGRVPTEKGYRYFVDMEKKERALLVREEDAAKKRLDAMQGRYERRLEAASEILSELTHNMGFAGLSGELFSHGLSNLFSQPEFANPTKILKTAELIDNLTDFFMELPDEVGTRVFIGSESPIGKSAGCSIILSEFSSPYGERGYIGVLGPMRMSYDRGLAAIEKIKETLEKEDA